MIASLPAASLAAMSKLYWVGTTARWALAGRRVPWLPAERLRRLQDRRVRDIVAHAYRTVPFYRRAMDARGLRPADLRTTEDLARLPLVDGHDVASNPEDFQSTALEGRPVLEVWSSGSSGHVKKILWDRAAVFRVHASTVRHRDVMASFLGRTRGFRVLILDRRGGTRDHVMAFIAKHSGFASGLGTIEERASLADSFEHNVAVVNRFRPDLVMGFSGYIGAMFRWAASSGRHVARPRLVWSGGEMLPEPDRRLLQEDLGIPVVQGYQSCEALRIAFQCEHRDHYHVHVDQVAVRVVDAVGETVPSGTRGRIVVSSLLNRATVLLNYVLGDLGTATRAACPCGRTLPMLATIDGREDDFLARRDGSVVHTAEVIAKLCSVPGVARLQVIQQALDRFHVRVMCADGSDGTSLRVALERGMAALMGTTALSTEIEHVSDIAAEPSGKFKIVISRSAGRQSQAPAADPIA